MIETLQKINKSQLIELVNIINGHKLTVLKDIPHNGFDTSDKNYFYWKSF